MAAGSRNPHGLEYRSWHQGEGSLVCFKRDPRRALGTRAPAVGRRPRRLLAAAGRRGEAVASARPGSRHPGCACSASTSGTTPRQAPPSVTDAPTALDHPLPGRPLPALPVAGRGSRARTPRPRHAPTATDPRRAAPPRAPRRRGRNRGAERRDRPLVGARRRPPSPAPRGSSVGVDRSRRRRVRQRALRRAGADPRRVRAPTGLRHPLRQRASGPAHRAPGRGRPRSVQHGADDAAARPRAIAVGTVGRRVRRRDAGRDPAAPGTRRRHRLRAAPRGDPQPRRRDPAAVPTQPLPPNQTAQPTARRAGHRPPGQRVHRPTRDPGVQHPAPSRPRIQRAHPSSRSPTTASPAARRRRTTATTTGPRPRSSICPTSRGSQRATQPGRRATSKTRPPATTPPATS